VMIYLGGILLGAVIIIAIAMIFAPNEEDM
jgi:hypothetical protein